MQLRRTTIPSLLALAMLAFGAGNGRAVNTAVGVAVGPSGQPVVNLTFFHNELQPYGRWVSSPAYGEVFVPSVASGWRPYSHGRWAYTDAGWTWVSAEPFGWATDHYGRWVYDAGLGWEWMPGTQWAPAYVSWQSNDQYYGWAPLPPTVAFDSGYVGPGFDYAADIAPASYVFVPANNFLAADIATAALPVSESVVIFPRTRNITNFRMVHGMLFNGGLALPVVERVARVRVPRFELATLRAPARDRIVGTRVELFRARVTAPREARFAERVVHLNRVELANVRTAIRRGVAAQNAAVRPVAMVRPQALPGNRTHLHGLARAQERLAFNAARNPVAARHGLARAQAVIARNQQRHTLHVVAHQRPLRSTATLRVHQGRLRVERVRQVRVRPAHGVIRVQRAGRGHLVVHRAPMRTMHRVQVRTVHRMPARTMRLQARTIRMHAVHARPAAVHVRPAAAPRAHAARAAAKAGGHGHGKGHGGGVPY